jgi:hypothetical protein
MASGQTDELPLHREGAFARMPAAFLLPISDPGQFIFQG